MVAFRDTKHLPPDRQHAVVADARKARELARVSIRAGFDDQRRAAAAAEAEAARERIAEAGGIRAMGRADYKRELAAMQSRLRRAR